MLPGAYHGVKVHLSEDSAARKPAPGAVSAPGLKMDGGDRADGMADEHPAETARAGWANIAPIVRTISEEKKDASGTRSSTAAN